MPNKANFKCEVPIVCRDEVWSTANYNLEQSRKTKFITFLHR